MKKTKTKPPIGTANTGYHYETEVKAPFGEALVNELKKLGNKNRSKKKAAHDAEK